MKLRGVFALFLSCCILFCGCNRMQNMTELLAYEQKNVAFDLKIQDEKEFSVRLTQNEQEDIFSFSEGTLAGISIAFLTDGAVEMRYEDYKTPLPSSALLKALRWKELFHLSEKNLLWKIQKETLGGLEVYCCKADSVTVYIDSGTLLPLKITDGKTVVDVMQVIEP